MIIVHMKNYTEKKKKKRCFSPHKNVIFLGRSVIFPGVLGEEYSGSEINFFRQAPTCDWKIFQSSDGKCVHQNSVNKFVPSQQNTKTRVFQDDFLHEYIPTPERS